MVLLRERTRPGVGIIEPCLPSPAKAPPSSPGWIHEIKHDGFRILARRDAAGVRLITRAGNDSSEKARANRRLIHGPKEFRDIRGDQPRRRK
jgi:ATP-dependent DNA ligase